MHYLDSIIRSQKTSRAPGILKRYTELYYERKGEAKNFTVRIRKNIYQYSETQWIVEFLLVSTQRY